MQCNFPEEVASFIGETARCAMGFRELLLVLCSYRPGTQHSGDPKGGIVCHLYMFVHCMVYSTISSRPGAEVSGGRKPISQRKNLPIECVLGHQPVRCSNRTFGVRLSSAVLSTEKYCTL